MHHLSGYRQHLLCAFFWLMIPARAWAQAPAGFEAAWEGLSSDFQTRLSEEGVVGGSLWVLSGGEVIGREHVGMADLEPPRPVDDATIFHWASITKTFTAIAAMQLRDQGLLSLDDSVVDYLPSLRQVHNPFGPMEDITIGMLLSHSAGFRSPTWPWGGDEAWHEHEPTKWSQLEAMMPYTEIGFEPGSRYQYSNPGIIFVGEIIEQLSGDDIEVYIDKNILKPLRMYSTYFDATPRHLMADRSNNFDVVDGVARANGLDFDTGITVSNGGLNAPLTDMAKYLNFLLGHCPDAACEGVLSRSSLQEMWDIRIEMQAEDAIVAEEGARHGVGTSFFVSEFSGDIRIIGHTGSQKSFRSFFVMDPEADIAGIGVTNTVGRPSPDADFLRTEFKARLVGEVFPLFR